MRDPVARTFSDLYHVKFAPEDDVHGLIAEKLWLLLQNKRFLPNILKGKFAVKRHIFTLKKATLSKPNPHSTQSNSIQLELRLDIVVTANPPPLQHSIKPLLDKLGS